MEKFKFMKTTYLLFITALLAVSCQKEEKASDKISAKASDSLATIKAAEAQLANVPVTPQTQQIIPQPNAATTNAVPVTKPGMNPPHGQPGHRCDLAVGAPLNSKPAAVTPAPAATNQTYTVTPAGTATATKMDGSDIQTATPVAQKTLPGMEGKPNPAHGAEGHRCDIPVGVTLP